jgi:hypothetical protein
MEIYKKIIILILIILFIYVGYRLLKKINCCSENRITREGLENLNSTNEEVELNSLKSIHDVTINSIHKNDINLPLSQYVIKGSYNSAVTGDYMSYEMVKYVLSRGCRFLDFEVFLIDGKPKVAYTTDSKYKTIQTKNSLLLDEVFSVIVSNAFSNISPNRLDPIFIHLRIKSSSKHNHYKNEQTNITKHTKQNEHKNNTKQNKNIMVKNIQHHDNNNIYKHVAKSLSIIKNSLYNKQVNRNTKLKDIMGKIIIVMDNTINYHYKKYTSCYNNEQNCNDLKKYINLESGNGFINIERYSDILKEKTTPPHIVNDINTDVKKIKLALPDYDIKHISNPKLEQCISDYGCQIVTYRYYKKDANLSESEDIFNENKFGIVPLSTMLKSFEKKKEQASN